MADKYGILIGGGFRETKGELLRIGHMGYQASTVNMMATIEAMKKTMEELQSTKQIMAR
jgi:aspartate aminotransferase-like enzyme